MLLRRLEHVQVDLWIFVPGEAYVTDLASLLRFDQRYVSAFPLEDAMRVFETDNLMVLDQINAVCLQPPEGFFQLLGSCFFGASVNFGHQEDLAPVTIAQRFAHPHFTEAV